jgi:hypothetical protein
MTTHPGRRHRHSFATATLFAIFLCNSYQLGIDAFQPHSHGVAIPNAVRVRPVSPISTPNRLPLALTQPLFARANDDEEESSDIQDAEIIPSSYTSSTYTEIEKNQKNQLSQAYTVGQYLFLATAFLHLWTVRPASLFLESEFARSTEWGAAAGYGVAAGISYVLKGAVDNKRLSSDTYKRLSVGLLGFCLLGLAAVPGEAAFVAVPGNAAVLFTIAVKFYGTAISFVGWKRGVVGIGNGSDSDDNTNQGVPRIMLQEFATGLLQTAKGLKVQNAKKALTYRNCLLLVVGGMFSNFMEGIFDLRVSTHTVIVLCQRLSCCSL